MANARVLVVDDEEGMLEVCSDTLNPLPDTEVVLEQQSPQAAELLRTEDWDLLIADIRMPNISGMELLQLARECDPDLDALIITAFPSVETAVETLKLGAADYITKPFRPEELRATVNRILEARRLRQENHLLRRYVERPYSFGEIIGRSEAMQDVFATIEQVADTNTDILIHGETGTGKELVARSLHQHSSRSTERFVPVNCGAIPEDLLESEFFGHERGAFTGAHRRSLGLLEYAGGGTFFLDEIGELPLSMQAKLLRALQERQIRRVGGKSEIDIDVRIIAATSRKLKEEMEQDRFRADLYYRINVVRIVLPPLRKRTEDIPLLTHHFVEEYASEMGRENVEIDPLALEVLASYEWPGNVRELQNVIKRLLTVTRHDAIRISDLPDEIVTSAGSQLGNGQPGFFDLRDQHVSAFEKRYLRNLLSAHEGNVTEAASDAQLPRGTLYRFLNKHDLAPADFRPVNESS